MHDLAGGHFIAEQRNRVLVGGTGTGKTHLAIAIAGSCIRAGSRGRFFNTLDLVNRLEAEARAGRQGRFADYLSRMVSILRRQTMRFALEFTSRDDLPAALAEVLGWNVPEVDILEGHYKSACAAIELRASTERRQSRSVLVARQSSLTSR